MKMNMMEKLDKNQRTRRRLVVTTSILGVIGAAAWVTPFVRSMLPSARARSEGAPVDVEIGKLKSGQFLTVIWRKKPIWVFKRTKSMLDRFEKISYLLSDPMSDVETQQPEYVRNLYRSIKPEIFVVIPLCTHLGCIPTKKLSLGIEEGMESDWPGGFYCPCHGSKFDLAGRVFKNVPAPTNLVIPPYFYVSNTHLVIGVDQA